MKTLYIMPQGKVPKLSGYALVRMTEESFSDVYEQYLGYPNPLCIVLSPSVPTAAVLKFVEEASSDFSMVTHFTPDLVFLSRFSVVRVGTKPTLSPFPLKSSAQILLEECKALCR